TIWDVDPARARFTAADLAANKIYYTVLLIASVLGMSNAFARAVKLVDDQRARLFEQSRLSAIGSMACNIAHEINTPLMAIDLEIDALEDSVNDLRNQPAADSIRKLAQLSRQIAAIVRRFKLMSYSDADDPVTELPIGKLIERALDIAVGRIDALGITLSVELHDPAERLRCRVVALSQVLVNVVDNSCDAVAE